MNINRSKYKQFALCREMAETPSLIRQLEGMNIPFLNNMNGETKGIFISGEGSSRIIPAKHLRYYNMLNGSPLSIITEGATQALEYDLEKMAVIGISNSGKTKELIRLFNMLKKDGHNTLLGITANANTPLEALSAECVQLQCGKEEAVAATKSVVEQALILEIIYNAIIKGQNRNFKTLRSQFEEVLNMEIESSIVEKLANSKQIYFAGRNNGIAEELALKTNEITHKKSDFLEGTYCVHGIEEVMSPDESVLLINPFPSEEDKFYEVLVEGVGMNVVAISDRPTRFETILIPADTENISYLLLAAGWNLLVEIGLLLGVNLDKAERARKIGNEYLESENLQST